uniref:Uncharacterized protein n=1 Tax=Aquisalinus luteolus TaxID=1566827 RepID=A0A8J3A0H6_9PROT|nr:hypothetical protein GCM10011355_03300 [Aquisalinus luteolus]
MATMAAVGLRCVMFSFSLMELLIDRHLEECTFLTKGGSSHTPATYLSKSSHDRRQTPCAFPLP